MLRGRGWLLLGVGIGIMVVGTTGCTAGLRSTQGRNTSSELTLSSEISGETLTGTVDESASTMEVVSGSAFHVGPLMVLELGSSFGVRRFGFESATDGLQMVRKSGGNGFYDAYYVGLTRPLTGWDEMNIGVYGRVQMTGFARMAPGSSGTFAFEGGVEADLPTGNKRNRVFVRVGLARDGVAYELERDDNIGRANGSSSFIALVSSIGMRLWDSP